MRGQRRNQKPTRKQSRSNGGAAACRRRQVADRADQHRAEQDPGARLPARRDHGPPDVRRDDLPAADGRVSDAGDRPADGGHARLVHRPRRDAAVDARGPQHGHDRRATACLRGRGRARLRPVSRRRHRELHGSFSTRDSSWCARGSPTRTPRTRSSNVDSDGRFAARIRPPVPHPGSARRPAVPDGARARGRRRAHPDDPRGRDAAPHNASARRSAAAGQYRRRHCRGLRRPGHAADRRQRALHHLARPGYRGAGPGRARAASTRCGRSIRRTTSTTDRRSGGCRSGGSKHRDLGLPSTATDRRDRSTPECRPSDC